MHRLLHSLLAGLTLVFLQTNAVWAAGPGSPTVFTVLASTDLGESLVAQKPGVTTIRAALELALAELARQFGTVPAVGRAYEDAHDRVHRCHQPHANVTPAQWPIRGMRKRGSNLGWS